MTLETTGQVGPDGQLHVRLPSQFANTQVFLTVRPANGPANELTTGPQNARRATDLEESHHFVRQFAGRWEGEQLSRPDQGEFEARDELR